MFDQRTRSGPRADVVPVCDAVAAGGAEVRRHVEGFLRRSTVLAEIIHDDLGAPSRELLTVAKAYAASSTRHHGDPAI
jgi:hypothetical protein